jgi:uncharacterized damage-inducible protein DinB
MTASKATAEHPLNRVLIERWEQVFGKFAALAQEVPEEKFESAPVAGLRTCADVVRHVAFWNQYVSANLLGEEFNDSANQVPAAEYPSRKQALGVLRDSAMAVAAALRHDDAEPAPSKLELLMTFIEHTSEHYGQLAVYARVMGIVPPASRG